MSGHDEPKPREPSTPPRRVVVVVSDLFFATRIAETAHALEVAIERRSAAEALAACRAAPPDLIVIDLHALGDPLSLARSLKSDPETARLPIVAFYAHVDRELREQALAAGIDQVLPRSAFTVRLPALLGGEGRSAT